MFVFCFAGHNFEYESRNCLRIFDLNVDYQIKKYDEFKSIESNEDIKLISLLDKEESYCTAYAKLYYNNTLLYEAKISKNEVFLEIENDKKLEKMLVVKTIYRVLSNYYKIKSDYGILTGVRPVKILFAAKHSGKSDDEINDILKNTYEISPEKIKLLWEVSSIEEKYIDRDINRKNYNLYIGIPFCPSKCSYCSFTSYVNKDKLIDEYINAVSYETEKTVEMALRKNLKLNSVYVGGGTPSVLNAGQISSLFNVLKKYYDLSELKEITFEAGRPDTITKEKLIVLKANNVNRISINPQTMNQNTLNNIGRKHSVEDIIEKYHLARQIGFNSINMDIILGLPGENQQDAEHTIDEILKLRPDNITVHSLSYKSGSELKIKSEHQLLKDYEMLKKMHETIDLRCIKEGYKPYYMYRQKNIKGNLDNVGYALNGKESIYNIVIIEEIETILACGAGVASKIKFSDERHEPLYNFKGIEEYIRRMDEILKKKEMLLNCSELYR